MKQQQINTLLNNARKHVKHYQSDIELDRKTLQKEKNIPFIHISREYGTAMITFFKASLYPANGIRVPYLFGTADNRELLEATRQTLEYYLKENPLLIQYFNGTTLKTINSETAHQHFATYQREILNSPKFTSKIKSHE